MGIGSRLSPTTFAGICAATAAMSFATATSATSIRTEAIVRVYSAGELVATYEAVDKGVMEGDCLVFHIRKGAREPEVRVCGTFVVESVR